MAKSRLESVVRHGAAMLLAAGIVAANAPESFAEYPDRPVDFIVTWGAGGGADKFARKLAPIVEKSVGVALPVSNVPGAAGNKGLGSLQAGNADGYSFATMTGVTFSSLAGGQSPYKVEDFDWLVRVQISPSMLFVKADSQFKTFDDLVAYAKANPGKLTCATDGLGTPADLTLRYLAAQGIKMKNIPFDKPAERYTAPLGGQTDVLYEEPGDVREFLVSGKLRPLIVFDEKRFPNYDVPASYDIGHKVAIYNWRGLVMKKGTPADRMNKLAAAFRKGMEDKGWVEYCDKNWSCDKEAPTGDAFKQWARGQFDQLKTFSEKY
ncbi:MAG: tripartite tricarboxylate transporter substrate binding protein [Hyphomicrobiales bacterium]